jgi:hypothetical protein
LNDGTFSLADVELFNVTIQELVAVRVAQLNNPK